MNTQKKSQAIAKVFTLADEETLTLLLDDLLTESEIDKIHERIKIIECLSQKLSQRATAQRTHAAIATVTRGASLMKKPTFVLDQIIHKSHTKHWWKKLFWNH